eukprot:1144157-Pelagomonas_calceolata.AAC.1
MSIFQNWNANRALSSPIENKVSANPVAAEQGLSLLIAASSSWIPYGCALSSRTFAQNNTENILPDAFPTP